MIENAFIGAVAGAAYGIVGFLDKAKHNPGIPFEVKKIVTIVILSGFAGAIVGWQTQGIPAETEIITTMTMLTSLGAGKIVERLINSLF